MITLVLLVNDFSTDIIARGRGGRIEERGGIIGAPWNVYVWNDASWKDQFSEAPVDRTHDGCSVVVSSPYITLHYITLHYVTLHIANKKKTGISNTSTSDKHSICLEAIWKRCVSSLYNLILDSSTELACLILYGTRRHNSHFALHVLHRWLSYRSESKNWSIKKCSKNQRSNQYNSFVYTMRIRH